MTEERYQWTDSTEITRQIDQFRLNLFEFIPKKMGDIITYELECRLIACNGFFTGEKFCDVRDKCDRYDNLDINDDKVVNANDEYFRRKRRQIVEGE